MKIHIIGIAGSGKTTLAHRLSRSLRVRAYDLDPVVYDNELGERPLAVIEERIARIREGASWVTEGAYRDAWLHPLLGDADRIVWLDVGLAVAGSRMLKRHISAEIARTNMHPGWLKLLRFLDYNRRTAAQQRAETLELLAPHKRKVTRCKSAVEIEAIRRSLAS